MNDVSLPGARAAFVGPDGLPQPYFYKWCQSIGTRSLDGAAANAGASEAIKTIAIRLGSTDGSVAGIPPQGNAAQIRGNGSISIDGSLAYGIVNITLEADTSNPGVTAYYGTDANGDRGWFPVSRALTGSDTVTVSVDAATGISTFQLEELPDAGGGSLAKVARDAYGRVAGTSEANTDDLPEGEANQYFTAERLAGLLVQGNGISLAVDPITGAITISVNNFVNTFRTTRDGAQRVTRNGDLRIIR